MTYSQRKPASYQDILNLPEHLVGEIIGGELYIQPRPAPRHGRITSSLSRKLFQAFDTASGAWWIFREPESHLGPHILVPDIAGWRRERLPKLPNTAWFELAPDWVCEVLSPSTARKDRAQKMPLYAAQKVGHIWLVDPDTRTLEVYENTEGRWLLLKVYEDQDEVSAAPFDAISFALGGLWAD